MRNHIPILPKDGEDSMFSISDISRERSKIGVCITSTNNPSQKHVNCLDKISCSGVRIFINPKNENQYCCPRCCDILDINQATYKSGIKPTFSDNAVKNNNTFIIAQQYKRDRKSDLDDDDDKIEDLKALLGESTYLVEEWKC
ncbi:MAG: hypothetical protein ACPKPY_00520 [Nitrososphaeraceae archaeon]